MSTRKLVYTAMFVAIGIILPQLFHMVGGPGAGAVFLPMHIPVLIGAILLGPITGVIIGCLSVLVGFMLGMPALPMAVFMFLELGTYGLVAGYLGYTKKINVYIALISAMLAGRLVSLMAMNVAVSLIGWELPPVFGTVAIFAAGVPGMIVQIILVPALVMLLRRLFIFEDTQRTW